MSNRTEYAKAALIGLLHPGHTYMPRHLVAKEAFLMADAMMAEEAKVKPSGSMLHAEGRERVQATRF
jgi:hypothetical protein